MISQVRHLNLGIQLLNHIFWKHCWIRIRMKYMLPIITLFGVGGYYIL
jgi:hypothetical protein